MARQRASQARAAFARVGTAPVPTADDDASQAASAPASIPDDQAVSVPDSLSAGQSAGVTAGISASQNDSGNTGRSDGGKAGDLATELRHRRRVGRPRGPRRVALTVRILQVTDDRLTAVVEATGRSPQYIVDEALARYLDSIGH